MNLELTIWVRVHSSDCRGGGDYTRRKRKANEDKQDQGQEFLHRRQCQEQEPGSCCPRGPRRNRQGYWKGSFGKKEQSIIRSFSTGQHLVFVFVQSWRAWFATFIAHSHFILAVQRSPVLQEIDINKTKNISSGQIYVKIYHIHLTLWTM